MAPTGSETPERNDSQKAFFLFPVAKKIGTETEIPSGIYSLKSISNHIREQSVEVMSLNRVQFCVGRLETARLAISKQTDIEHIQSLQLRHGRWKL